MQELLRVSLWAPEKRPVAFEKFVARLAHLGYEPLDGPTPYSHCRTMWVPAYDRAWKREVEQAVKAGALAPNWSADWREYRYTEDDVATAPLFDVVHVGRDINIPRGGDTQYLVTHITDVDMRHACPHCGAGGRQRGPVRLSAAELNKAGRLASIWLGSNTFWMVSDSLLRAMSRVVTDKITVQPVAAIGKAKAKEQWWQLMPEWAPHARAIRVSRTRVRTCSHCRAPTLNFGKPRIMGNFSTADRRLLARVRIPPILCSPYWEGSPSYEPDGRVREFPQRRLMLRGDLGRFLMDEGINGLEVTPVVYG